MSQLSRTSKVPLYQQLYELLRSDILTGAYRPGDLLPPESELAGRHAVSVITVRQALDMLEKDGLIERQRGRGTFVAYPTLEQGLLRIVSFTEDMQHRGMHAGTRVLSALAVPADADTAEKLAVPLGEPLARIVRLRLAEGEPLSLEEAHLVLHDCPGVLDYDFSGQSLRRTLEAAFGIRLVRARQTIKAVPAQAEIARLLAVRLNAPLLLIERVSYSELEAPIEFLRIYYRGDRYVLYNELQG